MLNSTHEQTVNVALGEVLHGLRRSWTVRSERTGQVLQGGGRPDVLIEEGSGWPVVIEAELSNHAGANKDAVERLGRVVQHTGLPIETAIALVYPAELHTLDGAELRNAIRSTESFEYALYTHLINRPPDRLPTSGWLTGNVRDLAVLVQRATAPPRRVDALARRLQDGIQWATEGFTQWNPYGEPGGAKVAAVLGQSDDEEGQTRRMAMTVVATALIFHEALAESNFVVEEYGEDRHLMHVDDLKVSGFFSVPSLVKDEWGAILRVNYWPIFWTANQVLNRMSVSQNAKVLNVLWRAVQELVAGGVTRSHDLTGIVFQRLIADRKFLATFYTKPAAASLLAGLAMPADRPPGGADWGDGETLAAVQIGDFACGTGTLLSAAYQRMSLLHELHGGNPRSLHAPLMKHGIVGLDVLNMGVHLTAAMLAGSHPDTPFEGECLLTMPYGEQPDGSVAIGSLDLLEENGQYSIIKTATGIGGRSEKEVNDLVERVAHDKFDLVIMNPPFTRSVGQEGDRVGVGNPAFAAFETSRATQRKMQAALVRKRGKNPIGNGNAGLAADFLDLVIRKSREDGVIALVLPLSALSGTAWEQARQEIRREYTDIIVVTIAASGNFQRSFSADTGIAECLLIARRNAPADSPRALFAILESQPESAVASELIANMINGAIRSGEIRRLEDISLGGSSIRVGDTSAGQLIDCPLPASGPWTMAGIDDVFLAQSAYHLARGRIALADSSQNDWPKIPITDVGSLADRGPYHADINQDTTTTGAPRGPFQIISPQITAVPTYPVLWAHNAKVERTLILEPDSEGQIKTVSPKYRSHIESQARRQNGYVGEALDERMKRVVTDRVLEAEDDLRQNALRIWATATRAHYNRDLRFNSQSLIVAMTERKCLGGRAWPSVIFDDDEQEYAFALWCNSTLGLLMHWWTSNKTQSGRGTTTVTSIPNIPTLDTRKLSAEQLSAAREAFYAMRDLRFLPFDQIDEDPARTQLDRRLLVDVLGLPSTLCEPNGPIDLLRRKLAAEPQIHGGKKTRVIFYEDRDDDGQTIHRERKEVRTDR